jgi:hypothetical protein
VIHSWRGQSGADADVRAVSGAAILLQLHHWDPQIVLPVHALNVREPTLANT